MYLERINQQKESLHLTNKMISERTKGYLTERTIGRVLSGETENPRIDTIIEIGEAIGLSPREIFDDTDVRAVTPNLIEAKEAVNVMEAARDLISAENDVLKAKVAAMTSEIELLKREIMHKDELLALHKYYNGLLSAEQR